jgi:FHA domain
VSRLEKPQSFIADLNELRQRVGNPSLEQLVRLSDRRISKSTLSAYLSERRVHLPPWRLVQAYVAACRAAAAATGNQCGWLGTDEQWLERWEYAMQGRQDARSPFQDPTPPHDDLADKLRELTESLLRRQLMEDVRKIQESLSEYTALLVVTSGENIGRWYEIGQETTRIGRGAQNDIWLDEATVSRRHAEIYRRGDYFIIRDMQSANGTYCRGQRIIETLLSSYDELKIGSVKLMFVQGLRPARAYPR